MMTEPKIVERQAQPYLAIVTRLPFRDIAKAADEVLPELFSWIGRKGIAPSGAPFFKYNVINMSRALELEVGVPVSGKVEGDARVVAGILPGGRYASLVNKGPYDRLIDANAALLKWIAEKHLKLDVEETPSGDRFGCRLEIYHTDPAREPEP